VDAVTQPDGTRNVRFGILADDGRAKFLVDIPRVEAPDNAVRIVCNERDAYVEGPGFRSSLHVVGQTIFGEVQTDRGRMHPVQIPGVLARFDESADLRLSVFGDASRSVSLRADSVPNEAVNMARGGASMDKVVDPHTYGTLGLDLF
jgi:hypothetical protein